MDSLVSRSKVASPEKPKTSVSKPGTSGQPEPQIFTTTTNVYNTQNFEGQPYAIVEVKPSIPRSSLPPEGDSYAARGKRPTPEACKQKVSSLKKQLASELYDKALSAQSKEAERMEKLGTQTDPTVRSRLELQFEIDRARAIQQLVELEEYVLRRSHKRQVQQLAVKLGVSAS